MAGCGWHVAVAWCGVNTTHAWPRVCALRIECVCAHCGFIYCALGRAWGVARWTQRLKIALGAKSKISSTCQLGVQALSRRLPFLPGRGTCRL